MAVWFDKGVAKGATLARRTFIKQLPVVAAATAAGVDSDPDPAHDERIGSLYRLEFKVKGRLGVHVATASGRTLYAFNSREWMAMCSTFKLPLAGAVLSRVDARADQLDRAIAFGPDELLPTSPVTSAANGKLSVKEAVSAILEVSDNTAANLLLKSFGGPKALTAWLREVGDPTTRLDRYEPELNLARPGDPRDTTNARAMAELTRKLVFGDMLSRRSRDQIAQSMIASQTGRSMLRAGLPKGWRIGDKSGRGGNGATHNVAVVWPPKGEPVVIAAYLADCKAPLEEREAVLAEIGHLMTAIIGPRERPATSQRRS